MVSNKEKHFYATFKIKMPKYSHSEKSHLIEQAKKLYAQGVDASTCAKYLNIALPTMRGWIKKHHFDQARKAHLMQRPQILAALIDSFHAMLNGEAPKITADQAVKYASSFEKLSDKKKLAGYTFEAFEALTTQMLDTIQKTNRKADKEKILEAAKITRGEMDKVIDKMIKEAFDD